MSIQVLFQSKITHKSHSADAAVELHALKNFYLSGFLESDHINKLGASRIYLLFEGVRVSEIRDLRVVRGSVVVTVCLGIVGRTSLVKDKISKRQLLSFIERTERL